MGARHDHSNSVDFMVSTYYQSKLNQNFNENYGDLLLGVLI